jgi:hypothetical protein
MREFMQASAKWAAEWNVWPWGGPKDEDDDFYYTVTSEQG